MHPIFVKATIYPRETKTKGQILAPSGRMTNRMHHAITAPKATKTPQAAKNFPNMEATLVMNQSRASL